MAQSQPISSVVSSNNLGCVPRTYVQQQHSSQICENVSQNVNVNGLQTFKYPISQNMQNFMQPIQSTITTNRSINHLQPTGSYGNCFNRNRFMPYSYRSYITNLGIPYQQLQQPQFAPIYANCSSTVNNINSYKYNNTNNINNTNTSNNSNNNHEILDGGANGSTPSSTSLSAPSPYINGDHSQAITLQISNLDYTMDENSLRNFLLNQLKSITPVQSIIFEGSSCAKVTVPDIHVSNYKFLFLLICFYLCDLLKIFLVCKTSCCKFTS